MTVGILTEKNSASRNFAAALGGQKGTYNGEDYVIVAARGHLYEMKHPHELVAPDKAAAYKSWDLANLPWNVDDFTWARVPQKDTKDVISNIKAVLSKVDEIVIATDVDPSGEGELLAWEILDELNLHNKTITRMFFTDEAPASIQKAFTSRKPIASMQDDDDFRKADYRTKFDLLSMQSTRAASQIAGLSGRRVMLRNGRLKSAMVVLVGDQLKAHNEYKRVASYQARFRDDHGVLYTQKDPEVFAQEDQVPIGNYAPSAVEHLESKERSTAPPKLLDLAGLSTILSKQGMKPAKVLEVYQKMYEAQIVSYPRTEDRIITPEQFDELAPKVDAIAGVVGVDPAKLTHRAKRKTHVKTGGAHGANRPGPVVPKSLDALKANYGPEGMAIYEVLAKNFLTMFGEDYTYITHKGRVKDFPDFTGSVNEPKDLGWKAIFDAEAERKQSDDNAEDDDTKAVTLGTNAEPFVAEVFPPRPQKPTMDWLMKQLEKRNVGTGATRTSTFAAVTAAKTKKNPYPLMAESRGKITLQPAGEINYRLLPGTTIGDLSLTEQVYENMDKIAAGEMTTEQALSTVAAWVAQDIEIMRKNAVNIDDALGKEFASAPVKPRYTGVYAPTGEEKTFARQWGGYTLSDEECAKLLDGETVTVSHTLSGRPVTIDFTLGEQSFVADDGKEVTYFGLGAVTHRDVSNDPNYAQGVFAPTGEEKTFKRVWGGYTLTDDEVAKLLAGEKVHVDTTTEYGPVSVDFTLGDQSFVNDKGEEITYFGLNGQIDDSATHVRGVWAKTGKEVKFKRTWSSHEFTEAEIADLLAGKTIEFAATSKKGKPYTAKGDLQEQEYNGKKFIGFKADFGDKKGKK